MTAFEEKIKKFNKFYFWLVIAVFALFGAAIATALYLNVLAGVTIAICAAAAYILLVADEVKRTFGLAYNRVDGGLSVCVALPRGKNDLAEEERRIPERLLWLDVVELSVVDEKKSSDSKVRTLYVPRSVKRIKASFFATTPSLTTIRYLGCEEEWAAVVCEAELNGIEIIFEMQNEDQGNNENEAS